jgi:Na+-transporting methylmalonyl-CoA/oxaloacetate decarboxylase gamma subunit
MMDNPLVTVLMITVLGMGLLFLALAFFYGLLSGMARGLKERDRPARQQPARPAAGSGEEEAQSWEAARLQAAAAAIALARARVQAAQPGPLVHLEGVGGSQAPSAWWSLHHQRQLALRGRPGRGE